MPKFMLRTKNKPVWTETGDEWKVTGSEMNFVVNKNNGEVRVVNKYIDAYISFTDNIFDIGNGQAQAPLSYKRIEGTNSITYDSGLGFSHEYCFNNGGLKHYIRLTSTFKTLIANSQKVTFGGIIKTNCHILDVSLNDDIGATPKLTDSIRVFWSKVSPWFDISAPFLEDGDKQKLDLVYSLTKITDGEYQYTIVVDSQEIINRNLPIVIDPSVSDSINPFYHSRRGHNLCITPLGKHVWAYGDVTSTPAAYLQVKTSRDNGRSWMSAVVFGEKTDSSYVSPVNGVGDIRLVPTADGKVYVFFLAFKAAAGNTDNAEIYMRILNTDDTWDITKYRITTNEFPCATKFNNSYYTTNNAHEAAFDVYIGNNELLVSWWGYNGTKNVPCVRHINLDNLAMSSIYAHSLTADIPSALVDYRRFNVYSDYYNGDLFLSLNAVFAGDANNTWKFIKYNTTTHVFTILFSKAGEAPANAVPSNANFMVINSGNTVIYAHQKTGTETNFKICSMDGTESTIQSPGLSGSNIDINPADTAQSTAYSVTQAEFIRMPNGDCFVQDGTRIMKIDPATGNCVGFFHHGEYLADLYVNANISVYQKFNYENNKILLMPFGACEEDVSFIRTHKHYSRIMVGTDLGSSSTTKVFYNPNVALGAIGYGNPGQGGQTWFPGLPYLDETNCLHFIDPGTGMYYRTNNESSAMPTPANLIYVSTIPNYSLTGSGCCVFFDVISDTLHAMFVEGAGTVTYYKRVKNVWSEPVSTTTATYPKRVSLSGLLPDKNGVLRMAIPIATSTYLVGYDSYSGFSVETIGMSVPGRMIKDSNGDLVLPLLTPSGASAMKIAKHTGTGSWVTTNIPTYYATPCAAPYYYNGSSLSYVFQDSSTNEYHFISVAPILAGTSALQYTTANLRYTKTVSGTWQSASASQIVSLNTDITIPINSFNGTLRNKSPTGNYGVCRFLSYLFLASLNQARRKIIICLPLGPKPEPFANGISLWGNISIHWLELDIDMGTWTEMPLCVDDDSIPPVTGLCYHSNTSSYIDNFAMDQGAFVVPNAYGDPSIWVMGRLLLTGCNATSTWSGTQFKTFDYTQARILNAAPGVPYLRRPVTGAMLYSTTPDLTWYPSPDSSMDTQHYIVELSSVSDFSTILQTANSSLDASVFKYYNGSAEVDFPTNGVPSGSAYYKTLSKYVILRVPAAWNLSLDATYYWRVKAIG